jgi:hypothetical protein
MQQAAPIGPLMDKLPTEVFMGIVAHTGRFLTPNVVDWRGAWGVLMATPPLLATWLTARRGNQSDAVIRSATHWKTLRLASYNGHTAIVALLLDRGADVHARDNFALMAASLNGHTATVALLQKHV